MICIQAIYSGYQLRECADVKFWLLIKNMAYITMELNAKIEKERSEEQKDLMRGKGLENKTGRSLCPMLFEQC